MNTLTTLKTDSQIFNFKWLEKSQAAQQNHFKFNWVLFDMYVIRVSVTALLSSFEN